VTRYAFAVALLTAVYALALASYDPVDLAIGAVLSTVVVAGLRRLLWPEGPRALTSLALAGRVLAFPLFAAAVVWDVTVGTKDVALVVLGLRSADRAGIIEVPFGERTPNGILVTAGALTLSPGEVVINLDYERRVMLVHALDATDPQRLLARYEHIYQRCQRPVFP
jgi:multicomponent Na+:H+ antiporter subunit E